MVDPIDANCLGSNGNNHWEISIDGACNDGSTTTAHKFTLTHGQSIEVYLVIFSDADASSVVYGTGGKTYDQLDKTLQCGAPGSVMIA